MINLLIFVLIIVIIGGCIWLIIKSDQKDQESYDRWYNHPNQIWNLHKKDNNGET